MGIGVRVGVAVRVWDTSYMVEVPPFFFWSSPYQKTSIPPRPKNIDLEKIEGRRSGEQTRGPGVYTQNNSFEIQEEKKKVSRQFGGLRSLVVQKVF